MSEKNRIRNLSTRWLLPFKAVILTVYIGICTAIVYMFVSKEDSVMSWMLGLANAGIHVYFFFLLMRVTTKLHRVEFDQEFLYVILRKQDIIIPLENIESVEISTLGGVYKVNLYHAEQLGDHFYFKMSLFYPLNYQSRDALVNVLRKYIDQAKMRKQVVLRNALHS